MDTDRRVLFLQHQDDCGPGYLGDRARELGLTVEVADLAAGDRPADPRPFAMIVPLGSDDSVLDPTVAYLAHERAFLADAVAHGVPVLGVCFGAQLLATVLGARVRPLERPEVGWVALDTSEPGLVEEGPWLVWHQDALECPPGAELLASSPVAVQAFRHGPHLGVQFHPEATPESARAWAATYGDALGEIGVDVPGLIDETDRRRLEARDRAAALLDRWTADAARAPRPTILES